MPKPGQRLQAVVHGYAELFALRKGENAGRSNEANPPAGG